MIEVLLEAERALSHGLVDQAERLYRQVADSDPRSSIALVGLARVALERDDVLGAYLLARKALAIDPENPAASHLVMRMTEVLAGRGEAIPDAASDERAAPADEAAPPSDPAETTGLSTAARGGYHPPPAHERRPTRPGIIGRLLGRRRR